MASYQERVLAFLADGSTRSMEELVQATAPRANSKGLTFDQRNKLRYVIGAVKAAIAAGRVEKIITPGEARLWVGHRYRLANPG